LPQVTEATVYPFCLKLRKGVAARGTIPTPSKKGSAPLKGEAFPRNYGIQYQQQNKHFTEEGPVWPYAIICHIKTAVNSLRIYKFKLQIQLVQNEFISSNYKFN
jgi:hypothetical protein